MTQVPAADDPSSIPSRSGVGRASALLASGTMVSRLLGFVSAAVLAQTLGNKTLGANTFALANQLPNNIYALVAGGILSAILVPQIVRAGLHHDGGQKFINRIVTLGAVVFVAAAAVATVCAPLLVRLYATQSSDGSGGFTSAEIGLATAFAYWCLPQILFYALYSLLGEVLNARKVFGPFTWAPVVNNVVAIAGLLAFNLIFSSHDLGDVSAWTPGMVTLLAGSATLGVAAQAAVLFVFWRRAGLTYRPEFRWRGVGLGSVGKAAGWHDRRRAARRHRAVAGGDQCGRGQPVVGDPPLLLAHLYAPALHRDRLGGHRLLHPDEHPRAGQGHPRGAAGHLRLAAHDRRHHGLRRGGPDHGRLPVRHRVLQVGRRDRGDGKRPHRVPGGTDPVHHPLCAPAELLRA
jgi:hypothetical protein